MKIPPCPPLLKGGWGDLGYFLRKFFKFYQEGFHPSHPQHLADPPSLLAVPDPEAFPVEPDLDGFQLAPGSHFLAQHFDGFAVIEEAKVRPDPFHIDLDHLRLLFHALSLFGSLAE